MGNDPLVKFEGGDMPLNMGPLRDHFRLTKDDISALLEEARKTSSRERRLDIRQQICQAIPGYTKPPPLEGHVFEKEEKITQIYFRWCQKGENIQLALDEICRIIGS